jgi:hypothetical protein
LQINRDYKKKNFNESKFQKYLSPEESCIEAKKFLLYQFVGQPELVMNFLQSLRCIVDKVYSKKN